MTVQLEGTIDVLGEPLALADIREADAAYARGDIVRCGCRAPAPPVSEHPYEIDLMPPALRAITDELPEAGAAAVIDFVTTALLDNPQRVRKPVRDDLEEIWSARRGTYRVLYRIREDPHEAVVLRIDHRRDAYRSKPKLYRAWRTPADVGAPVAC